MTLTIGRCTVRVVCARAWTRAARPDHEWVALVRAHLDTVLPLLEAELAVPGRSVVVDRPVHLRLPAAAVSRPADRASGRAGWSPRGAVPPDGEAGHPLLRAAVHDAVRALSAAGPEEPADGGDDHGTASATAARQRALTALVARARARLGRDRTRGTDPDPVVLTGRSARAGTGADPDDGPGHQPRPAAGPPVTDRSGRERTPAVDPSAASAATDPPAVPTGAAAEPDRTVTPDPPDRSGSVAEGTEVNGPGEGDTRPTAIVPDTPAPVVTAAGAGPPDLAATAAAAVTERAVSSCLPFLLLGPLASVAVLDAVTVTFADRDRLADLPALGAALAAAVLPPPPLGWAREPEEEATIAVFAGPDAVAGEIRRDPDWLAPVQDALRGPVLAGRAPDDPVTVVTCPDGTVVVAEADGGFPIARVADAAAADRYLTTIGDPPRHADAASVGALFADLHARRPRQADPAVDGTVEWLVALGLALLAWRLSSPDHPVTAADVLATFADLDAVVRPGPDTLQVRIPLGGRYLALEGAGLLGDVTDVGWLPGVTVSFERG